MSILATDYAIVSAGDTKTLATKVTEQIKQGWHPHGSLQAAIHLGAPAFFQPMVKGTQQHSYIIDSLDTIAEKLEAIEKEIDRK